MTEESESEPAPFFNRLKGEKWVHLNNEGEGEEDN